MVRVGFYTEAQWPLDSLVGETVDDVLNRQRQIEQEKPRHSERAQIAVVGSAEAETTHYTLYRRGDGSWGQA